MQRSETIEKITEAMSKAQGAMRHAMKDHTNEFFKAKYADFASVVDVAREPLSANGLAVFQSVETDGPDVVITTLLSHSSGQWIETSLRLKPTKNDPQGVASAATYGKRIAFQALVVIAADVDDDGNAASSPERKPAAKTKEKSDKQPANPDQPVAKASEPVKAHPTPEQLAFNEWVKPFIDAKTLTPELVRTTIQTYKGDYAQAKAALLELHPSLAEPSGEPTDAQQKLADRISEFVHATTDANVLKAKLVDVADYLKTGELTPHHAELLQELIAESLNR